MSKYSIEDTTLSAIGNAIRTKDGSSGAIQVSNFADRILAIPSGGGGESTSNPLLYYPSYELKNFSTNNPDEGMIKYIIPKATWQLYDTISFKYSFNNSRNVGNDKYGSSASLYLCAVYNDGNYYDVTYSEYIESGTVNKNNITYTFNPSTLLGDAGSDWQRLGILVDVFKYDESDPYADITLFQLSNFTGTLK